MTTALLCCRRRWLEGSLPCSFYTVPCHPCSGKRLCQSPSSYTPLSPTPATASRAPASTAWDLQERRSVSNGCRRAAPSTPQRLDSLSLSSSLPLFLSLSLTSPLFLFPSPLPPFSPLFYPPHSSCSSCFSPLLFLLYLLLPTPSSGKWFLSQMVLPELPSGFMVSGVA